MAIKINFDSSHNAQLPTLILATKSGRRIQTLPAYDIKVKDSFSSYSSFEFKVNRVDCDAKSKQLWKQIADFKLVYCREFNLWFEIYVDVDESNYIIKNIVAKSLGEAELSQIYLNGIEVNTEDDISRDDYEPTILYNKDNPKFSLLDRIIEKAPNYKIVHVDSTIAKIQRTFSFDGKTILDVLYEVGQEINCLINVDVVCDSDGKISREIKAYDLESYCVDCGNRGEFEDTCPKCNGSNIISGYGEDTKIFVSTQNLADSIKYSTDTDSVKNCFRLLAGDDLMTATIASCNPNGSGYIWYISDKLKEDMSPELVDKLNQYDKQHEYYQNEHQIDIPDDILSEYNALVDKYSAISKDIQKMPNNIVGYPALMNVYYNTIDLYLLLSHNLMPELVIEKSSAEKEAAKLTYANLSPVAVQDLNKVSLTTATNAVLSMAKVLVDTTRYQVKVKDSSMAGAMWTGIFIIKSYTDDEDVFETNTVNVIINDDYSSFVKQKLNKALSNASDDKTDVVSLFALNYDNFKKEIAQYSLSRLTAFHDACQAGLDILIEQGISDNKSLIGQNTQLYADIYEPMYNKLFLIEDEIKLRESEIAIVAGKYDVDGELLQPGMQTVIDDEKAIIQTSLNMQKYLGEELWSEFVNYRREDTYQNDNYISDGLNNAELFERALEFIEVAQKEIYKSATLQHSISATMKNLLAMKEFAPLVDYFEIGNWIRVFVDNTVYKLRLIEYQVDYSSLSNIAVVFSDIKIAPGVVSDTESVLSKAVSMATSYGAVTRQASQGKKSNQQIDNWVTKGLALTNMKIVNNADNQNITMDSHGLLCKEYLPIWDSYDDKQLKIINRGLYLTDDNWRTSRAGIGDFTFYNPMTGKVENSYGVIADTLIGNLILSEKVGIYNTQNSITLDENGMVITASEEEGKPRMMFTVRKKIVDSDGNVSYLDHLYLDENGNLVINGTIKIQSPSGADSSSLNDLSNKVETIQDRIDGFNGLFLYIRYSEFADGHNMTATPNENTKYIGTCNTDEKVAPTSPEKYTWARFAGTDGTPGKPGTDGRTQYLHIKYSDDGETFTGNDGEDVGKYIGTLVDFNQADSMVFSDYKWAQFTGEVDIDMTEVQKRIDESADNIISEMDQRENNLHADIDDLSSDIRSSITSQINAVNDSIQKNYDDAMKQATALLNAHTAELGQYMEFGNSGLILGASSSSFKTVIDNTGMYFKEGDAIVSYVMNNQLHIPNAVIESTLSLGNFFFSPRSNGSVSLVWRE